VLLRSSVTLRSGVPLVTANEAGALVCNASTLFGDARTISSVGGTRFADVFARFAAIAADCCNRKQRMGDKIRWHRIIKLSKDLGQVSSHA
jgi:hypothetical protein